MMNAIVHTVHGFEAELYIIICRIMIATDSGYQSKMKVELFKNLNSTVLEENKENLSRRWKLIQLLMIVSSVFFLEIRVTSLS